MKRARIVFAGIAAALSMTGCLTTNTKPVTSDTGEQARQIGAALPNLRWVERRIGQSITTRGGNTVTARALDAPLRTRGGTSLALAAADIRACAGPRDTTVSPQFFLVQVGRTTRAPVETAGVKEPLLKSMALRSGDCTHGWIVFQLAKGDRPDAVLLASSSFVRWAARPTRARR